MAGRFGSVITAMATPFRDDYALDLDGAQELAAYLLDHGSDSLVIAGSTGESPTLTSEEKRELFREAPPGSEVSSGDDWAAFATACLGAVGVISVAAHLVGDRIHEMLELASSGDVPAARKIHEELSPVFGAMFITSNPIPLKTALELVGRPAGPPRLPLVPATTEERDRIRRALEDAGLL